MNVEAVFIDFCILSMLLVAAKILRLNIPFFQKHFIPVSLIAGILGLAGGRQGLGILPFSDSIANYSGLLITTLSASLFIGSQIHLSFRKMMRRIGDSFYLNSASELGQFGISILLGYLLAHSIFPQVSEWFGILMPAGFVGDHGTAAVVGGVLAKAGYPEAVSIGHTFATVGLVTGIFGGVFCINIAAKKGITSFISEMHDIPEESDQGIIPPEKRRPAGMQTIHPNALDSVAWHIALILTAVGFAYLISYLSQFLFSGFSVPVYGISLLTGILLNACLKKLHLDSSVDKQMISSLSSTASDYLIAFGVASINLDIVLEFWQPIAVMGLFGILYVVFYLFGITRKCAGAHWFEKGIFIFGWSAGAMSVAIMLLRIVDPDYSSGILEDVSSSWVFLTMVDILIVTFVPVLMTQGFVIEISLFLTAVSLLFISLSYHYYGRNAKT